MKTMSILLFFAASVISSSLVFASATLAPKPVELSAEAANKVSALLSAAEQHGNKSIEFIGGPQVTQYVVGNLTCYIQNSDASVSCSTQAELSRKAAKTVGDLLRAANLSGDKSIQFVGGPQVTQYIVGNLDCYFQNSDDSVSCSAGQ